MIVYLVQGTSCGIYGPPMSNLSIPGEVYDHIPGPMGISRAPQAPAKPNLANPGEVPKWGI